MCAVIRKNNRKIIVFHRFLGENRCKHVDNLNMRYNSAINCQPWTSLSASSSILDGFGVPGRDPKSRKNRKCENIPRDTSLVGSIHVPKRVSVVAQDVSGPCKSSVLVAFRAKIDAENEEKMRCWILQIVGFFFLGGLKPCKSSVSFCFWAKIDAELEKKRVVL